MNEMQRFRLTTAGVALAVAATYACSTGAAARVTGIDLHRVNWRRALVPSSVCGTPRSVRMRNGYAVAASGRWPAYPRVFIGVGAGAVVYGDLNGDGHDEAALQVDCANLGGTAGGQLAFAVIVYRPGVTEPVAVGVLTPQMRGDPHYHVPLVEGRTITHDKVTVSEWIYGPHDGDCCASGLARTVWHLRGRGLLAEKTTVLREPRP
ncbi:MAG: hypothetical protein M3P18_15815 [Actinomycetota bacterium]|nr:hypothetical protein [Actinomycetota bacterium]